MDPDFIPHYIEVTYAGGLELEKVLVKLDSIIAVQKPKSDKFGCIIQTITGEKYPITDDYDSMKELLLSSTHDWD